MIQQLPKDIERQNTKSLTAHQQNISDVLHTEHNIYMETVHGYKEQLIQCVCALESKQGEYLQLMQTAQASLDAVCEKHSIELNQFKTDLEAESRRAMSELSIEHTQALDVYLRQMKFILDDTKASMDSHVVKISDAVQGIYQSEQRYSAHLQETQQNFAEQIQIYLSGLSTAQNDFEQKYVNITDSLSGFVDT